jgi:hypothetical protein
MSVRRYRIPKTYGIVISYKTSIFKMSRKIAPFLERTHISQYNRRSMAITCFTDRGYSAMGMYDHNNRNTTENKIGLTTGQTVTATISDTPNFRRRSTTRNSVLQRNCPGLQAVRRYRQSEATRCQALQAV